MKVSRDRKATKALLPDEFAAKRGFKKRNGLVGCKYLLETNRLILRQCTPDDLAIFEEIFGDGEMMRHFGECKPLSAAEARAWLDSCISRESSAVHWHEQEKQQRSSPPWNARWDESWI